MASQRLSSSRLSKKSDELSLLAYHLKRDKSFDIDDFTICHKIGAGGFATVYLVAYQKKELYAVKGIKKDILVKKNLK